MGRRGKGEGSVYFSESDGLWIARTPGPNGRVKKFASKEQNEAIRKRQAWLDKRARGEVTLSKPRAAKLNKQSLAAYLLAWVEVHPMAESTRRDYLSMILTHIIPVLGTKLLLVNVSVEDVKKLIRTSRQNGVSKARVTRVRAVLSSALTCAVDPSDKCECEGGKIPFNPCTLARAPRAGTGEEIRQPLNEDEVEPFLAAAREHHLWPVWALLFGTGCRSGEICNLDVPDVSRTGASINIRQGKTKKSRRVVPLVGWVDKVVQDYLETTGRTEGPLFAGPESPRILPGYVNKQFHQLLRQAGLKDRRVHDLRHTFATLALAGGADIKVIAEVVGHASTAMTQRYASADTPTKRKAVNLFDRFEPKPKLKLAS